MPVANHPSAAIRKHVFSGRGQKCLELRLDRLGDQPTRAGSQNFGERIVDCPFLSKGNNSILGHGVTLLLGGSGGLITNPVTPPSSPRHPVSLCPPLLLAIDAAPHGPRLLPIAILALSGEFLAKRIDTRRNVRISDRFIRVGEQGLRQNNRAENSPQSARRW